MLERGNRNRIVISTKGCHPFHTPMAQSRLSRKDIETDLHQSPQALRADVIDLFWLHKDDPQYPVEDIIESLNLFIKSGQIRLIGCSNWAVEGIEKANEYAKKSG